MVKADSSSEMRPPWEQEGSVEIKSTQCLEAMIGLIRCCCVCKFFSLTYEMAQWVEVPVIKTDDLISMPGPTW